ncbi:MAG: hypothetical protein ACE368_13345 [Paracoccaceae bacterium]
MKKRISELGLLPVPYADLPTFQENMARAYAGFETLVGSMKL